MIDEIEILEIVGLSKRHYAIESKGSLAKHEAEYMYSEYSEVVGALLQKKTRDGLMSSACPAARTLKYSLSPCGAQDKPLFSSFGEATGCLGVLQAYSMGYSGPVILQ